MRKTVLLAFGTRPEAIKMAPLYLALKAQPPRFRTLCCVSAQHREMLDDVLRVFGIVPDIDLDVMSPAQGLAVLHARVLSEMQRVLSDRALDILLVHGDTTTSLASTQAAFYAGIPVGHVEAGLRSGDLAAPFPEEMNRRATALMARYHFAPTAGNRQLLIREGHNPGAILVTGNTVVDAVTMIARTSDHPDMDLKLDSALPFDWRRQNFVVVTCHRRENHGRPIADIGHAITDLACRFTNVWFVIVGHPNPAVAGPMREALGTCGNISLIDPLPYDSFIHLLGKCSLILTDSGGLQEEGLALGRPVLVMRDVTERPEGIEAGGAKLVGTCREDIVAEVSGLIGEPDLVDSMSSAPNPYGDGKAAARIVDFLAQL